MRDPFRPLHQPSQTIYDAFTSAAAKRGVRDPDGPNGWVASERFAVWRAARDCSQQHGLRVPTIEEVERAEQQACGHVDYASKWAYGVAEAMRER